MGLAVLTAVLAVGSCSGNAGDGATAVDELQLHEGGGAVLTEGETSPGSAGGDSSGDVGDAFYQPQWPERVRELAGLEPLTCDDLLAGGRSLSPQAKARLVELYVSDLAALLQPGFVTARGQPLELEPDERLAVRRHLETLETTDGRACGVAAMPVLPATDDP